MIAAASSSPLKTLAAHRPTPRPRPRPVDDGSNDGGDSVQTGSTSVSPVIGGGAIFPKAHDMIANAKNSVQLEMYEFENSQTGGGKAVNVPGAQQQQQLMQDLVDAAKRGVKVQVILDNSKEKNGGIHNSAMQDYLKSNGVEVLAYPPNTVNIDHVKLLITDNNTALIGGMNWGNHSPINHDADVLVNGQGARDLQSQIFEPDWQFSGGQLDHEPAAPSNDPVITPLQTAPTAENGGAHSILDTVVDQFNQAKSHAYVEMYTLTDQTVIDSMLAAKQRGVDVKVLLDPSEHHVNQKAFDQLSQAGIPVQWYKVDAKNHQLLHAKWGEFDDQNLIIGSGNWSANGLGGTTSRPPKQPKEIEMAGATRGGRHNHESDVLVHDAPTATAFDQQFQQDWTSSGSAELPEEVKQGGGATSFWAA